MKSLRNESCKGEVVVSSCYELLSAALADGKIDELEVPLIRQHLDRDGRLDLDDVKLLVELYCEAEDRCPSFDDLFFQVLERVILEDGEVKPSEQFYLLKMLYSDRKVRDREKQFLRKLRNQATRTSAEFEALCQEAFDAHPTDWNVGGG
jgi:hypothetical protein